MIKKDEIPAGEHAKSEHKSALRFITDPNKAVRSLRKHISFRYEEKHEDLAAESNPLELSDSSLHDGEPTQESIIAQSRPFSGDYLDEKSEASSHAQAEILAAPSNDSIASTASVHLQIPITIMIEDVVASASPLGDTKQHSSPTAALRKASSESTLSEHFFSTTSADEEDGDEALIGSFHESDLDARFNSKPQDQSTSSMDPVYITRDNSQYLVFPLEISDSEESDNDQSVAAETNEEQDLSYHWYLEMLNSPEFIKGSIALLAIGCIAIALSTSVPGVLGAAVLTGGVTGVGLGAAGIAGSLLYGFFKPTEAIRQDNSVPAMDQACVA